MREGVSRSHECAASLDRERCLEGLDASSAAVGRDGLVLGMEIKARFSIVTP